MTERISIEDLLMAAEWLDLNEGTDGESESCHRVAVWLKAEYDRRLNDIATRKVAREHGVSYRVARRALATVKARH